MRPEHLCAADLSKVQDDEVGDGTTSVAVLAGELLREAEQLVNQKLHPMTIIQGYRLACEVALEVLDERTFDNSSDPEKLRTDLTNIARTTLSSKILTVDKEHFSKIAVDAVMCLKGRTNLEPIHVIKKAGGTLKDSFLAEVLHSTVATVFFGYLLISNVSKLLHVPTLVLHNLKVWEAPCQCLEIAKH